MHGWEVTEEQGAPQQSTWREDLGGLSAEDVRDREIKEHQMRRVRRAVPREKEEHDDDDDAHHGPRDAFHQFSSQPSVLGKPTLEENQRNEHADCGELFASIDDHLVEVQLVDQRKQAGRDR